MKTAQMELARPTHVESYVSDRRWLSTLALSGFCLVLNHARQGAEYFDCTYPQEWQDLYDRNAYPWFDPVLLTAISRPDGEFRWSETKIPDIRSVMKKAQQFGLVYGATFTRTLGTSRSMLAGARHDREFTDAEMSSLSGWFTDFALQAGGTLTLTDKEIETLKCLADDMNINEAAAALCVSPAAVKTRLKSARTRLGCNATYQTIVKAVRAKLI